MKTFLHQWSIGLQLIVLWMCVTYALSAIYSGSDLGLLYSGIYGFGGVVLIYLMFFGIITKIVTVSRTLSVHLAFIIKGVPTIFLIIQVLLRIRSEQIQSSTGLNSQLTSFAIFSTTAIAIASLLFDWYQVSIMKGSNR